MSKTASSLAKFVVSYEVVCAGARDDLYEMMERDDQLILDRVPDGMFRSTNRTKAGDVVCLLRDPYRATWFVYSDAIGRLLAEAKEDSRHELLCLGKSVAIGGGEELPIHLVVHIRHKDWGTE